MLRMAKPMLTRARAKARKRSRRIVTWRPALSSFTRCGKTGKRRHRHFNVRAWLTFIKPILSSSEDFSRGGEAKTARTRFSKSRRLPEMSSWPLELPLVNNFFFLGVDIKSKCMTLELILQLWNLL
jgi:hypothetical protein